jgi:hypothetical protein
MKGDNSLQMQRKNKKLEYNYMDLFLMASPKMKFDRKALEPPDSGVS